jgi:hypothetical protein
VEVDAKGSRVFRWHPCEPASRKFGAMPLLVDNAINTDAVQHQPEPDLKGRADGCRVNPDADAPSPKLSEKQTGALPQRFA